MTGRITVSHLRKVYHSSELMPLAPIRALFGRRAVNEQQDRVALDDVSFTIEHGERVGIVGDNGAGKSTLLHIIAGVAEPSDGTVEIDGRVHALLTMGVSFRGELTGRQNLYVEGEIKGKSPEELQETVPKMIEFAELGEFIDKPIRTYSSGMRARLAFASSIFDDPEILIIDELLSVGDHKFNIKANKAMEQLCARGKIVLLVSHSMKAISQMCDRCLWLDNGRLRADGQATLITTEYREHVRKRDEAILARKFSRQAGGESLYPGAEITALDVAYPDEPPAAVFEAERDLAIRVHVVVPEDVTHASLRLRIERLDGLVVGESKVLPADVDRADGLSIGWIEALLSPQLLAPGMYTARVFLDCESRVLANRMALFELTGDAKYRGGRPVLYAPAQVHATRISEVSGNRVQHADV